MSDTPPLHLHAPPLPNCAARVSSWSGSSRSSPLSSPVISATAPSWSAGRCSPSPSHSADGLAAGQTQLNYKAVALGTVESIDLAPDNSHVVVKVRMTEVGARFLTSHARFWVERPRFNLSDISGIETLVSGSYITVDPGAPGGDYQTDFTGLEEPPGVRSDEPGSTYTLTARQSRLARLRLAGLSTATCRWARCSATISATVSGR